MKDVKRLAEQLFAMGKGMGFADMEINVVASAQFRVGIFKGEIDSYTVTDDSGLSFRGLYGGKMGYAFTEKLDDSSIGMLLENAKENAQFINSEDEEEIYAGSEHYESYEGYREELSKVDSSEKIELAKAIEQAAYALDSRVFNVQASFSSGEAERIIINSKGLSLSHRGNSAGAVCSVVARAGGDTKTGFEVSTGQTMAKFNAQEISRRAVEEACSMFGAATIESGHYPIILRHDIAATFLGVFGSSFSAENIQKGMSLLKGKLGELIGSEKITIIDDPFAEGRPNSCAFDAEGVATRRKNVVENGKLQTYLYNLKTAKKDGVDSTGNAAKGSYKGAIGIAPINLFIQPGEKSYDELIASVERGLIIISLAGTHAGANPVSGDFSLSAYGYLVESGKVVRPVNQITVAGNFFEMLRDVELVGNDLEWSGIVGAPSLLVKRLAVAGK